MTRSSTRWPRTTRPSRSRGLRRALVVGLAGSVTLHAALALLPPVQVELPPHLESSDRITLVAPPEEQTPPDVEVPPAPETVTRPEEPDMSGGGGGEPVASDDGPEFVPHDVPPRLLNPDRVQEYLQVFYPVALRAASVEGAVHLWLYVDESGRVTKVQVREPSGSPQFDELARSAAPVMRFRPAINQGENVGVWVSIWVRFDLEQPPPDEPGGRLVGGAPDEER